MSEGVRDRPVEWERERERRPPLPDNDIPTQLTIKSKPEIYILRPWEIVSRHLLLNRSADFQLPVLICNKKLVGSSKV